MRSARSQASGFLLGVSFLFVLTFTPGRAFGQAQIKVNDTVNLKFGILVQAWADWAESPAADTYAQNLFLRRIRFLVAGQVAPNLMFFYQTDNPNLGKAVATTTGGTTTVSKTISSGLITQDAFLTWKVADPLSFDIGLMFIPLCRNCIQSAASLLSIDYGAYTFSNSSATQSVVGRDTGFQAKGYVLGNHLEYRVGAFQGNRSELNNAFRAAGRLQYNFLEPEVGFFYPGTYLGTKKVLAVGAGFDVQKDYKAYAGDLFLDHPVGPGAVTFQFDYIAFDGGAFLTALPKQRVWLAELGYHFPAVKLTPWVKVDNKQVNDASTLDERRYQLGATYYLSGHNANIKAGVGKIDPDTGDSANLLTVQLQGFYF